MDKTIALYMRLSDEDDNLAAHEESNSISHQRKLMLDHIQKLPELKGCNILEFADDGYSGADFNRPNFVKMMDLVKAGKIQIIENGVAVDYSEEEATKILSEEAVTAIADVKMGDATATAWGCDLTYDYVKINADYRS